jgi:hypothetical protein
MNTIKYKVVQNSETKELSLHILRPIDDKEWMVVDHFNDMTVKELKHLADYIYSILKQKNANN